MKINVGRLNHLRSSEAERQVRLWTERQDRISDQAAVTVASWFQSPNGRDESFASLASTGTCDPQALVDACQREMESGHYQWDTEASLKALQSWAAKF